MRNKEFLLRSSQSAVQDSSASGVASTWGWGEVVMVDWDSDWDLASLSAAAMVEAMNSTWVSMVGGMLVKGPLGPGVEDEMWLVGGEVCGNE